MLMMYVGCGLRAPGGCLIQRSAHIAFYDYGVSFLE